LLPLVERAQQRLREVQAERLAQRSGCTLAADDTHRLAFFWTDYVVRRSDFAVLQADTGQETTSFVQALILTYLDSADGTPPSGQWIAYRALPNGMFYANAFRGYAENRLVRELDTDRGNPESGLNAFRRAARQLNGLAIDIGDAGYAFQVLPRIHLAVAYWQGDVDEEEESGVFGAQASILFEDSAIHYMSTDGLAVLGSHLANAIVRAAQTEGI
jgi:hypothetical protein